MVAAQKPTRASNADRTLIIWVGYAGYLVLCADGVPNRARLDVLLRRLTWGGSYLALVALLQFFTKERFDLAVGTDLSGAYWPAGRRSR